MSSRALRRHHRDRIWNKRRHYYGGAVDEYSWKETDPRKRMVISTPKMCAKPCCSRKKQRAWGDIPYRERQADSVEKQELQDWEEVRSVAAQ